VAFAIIAAGGRGTRLGDPTPKFELSLAGKPVISYSLEAFQSAPSIQSIVLVVPADRMDAWSAERLQQMGIDKVRASVQGGETRQDSVRLGLEQLRGETGVVVVHDAARPLVSVQMVEDACLIPDGSDGVVTATMVTDTVKCVDGGMVAGTPDRERLIAVQTPQAFRLDVLARAHSLAQEAGYQGTDDASLVERAGGRVSVIKGSRGNIKITFPGDLAVAEALLRERRAF